MVKDRERKPAPTTILWATLSIQQKNYIFICTIPQTWIVLQLWGTGWNAK